MVILTFREFGIPHADNNRTLVEWWLIESLQEASEEQLVALAEHCGIASLPSTPSSDGGHWEPDTLRLFLSHLSADKKSVAALATALLPFRVSAFVAHVDIEPTKEWEPEIERALRSADALCALLTPDFHASNWTDQEIGIAIGRGILVFSIRAGKDPYGFIGKYQALTGSGKKASELTTEIVDILAKHALTRERFAEVLVSSLEHAWSWEGCRSDMGILERFEYLGESHLSRLKASIGANEKVRTSHGVPARISRLAERLRAAS